MIPVFRLRALRAASDSGQPSKVFSRLEGIQLARFVAALLVVLTHATFYISSRINPDVTIWRNGAQGVNIFFVISGFVMLLSANSLMGQTGAFRRFISARLIRIVPLYWLLNMVKIVQILLIPALMFAQPTASNILFSMLFVPSRNAKGLIETFYGVGWTLNFEMFFYAVVAMALLWRRPISLIVTPVLLATAMLSFYRNNDWPAVTYLCHPVVLNFLWGMLIAKLYANGIVMRAPVAIAAIVIGIVCILFLPDAFLLELPYAILVAGIVALEPKLNGRIPRWLIFGGDASYSLYLVHPMVGVVIAVALQRLHVTSTAVGLISIVGGSLAAAAFTFRYLESPTTKALQRRFAAQAARPK